MIAFTTGARARRRGRRVATWPLGVLTTLAGVVLAGCGGSGSASGPSPSAEQTATEQALENEQMEGADDHDDDDLGEVQVVTRCEPEDLGADSGPIIVIYRVVDGTLGGICYGDDEPVVREAWDILTGFTPREERRALGLFAGFDTLEAVLAFATPVAETNDEFAIAVDLGASEDDPEELRLTMAHEFSHVFTQTQFQLDVDIGPEGCDTYWNGFGCFEHASYLDQWIMEFWGAEELSALPDDGGTDEVGGEDRCVLDPTFLGSYAASHPEEDFAESFSAFVFDLPVPADVEPKLEFFERFDELVVFRDLARGQGKEPPPNNFDLCG